MGPSDHLPPQPEALQGGPARPPLRAWSTSAGRLRGAALAAFVVGVVCGGAAAGWWYDVRQDGTSTSPPPSPGAGPRVWLVLTGTRSPASGTRTAPDEVAPLLVDGVLVHGGGPGSATVLRIRRPGGSLDIRTPALPVELSADNPSEQVRLRLRPRDCRLATQWTPSSRPFTLTSADERGHVRDHLSGDHEAATQVAMIGYLEDACRARAALARLSARAG